MFGLKANRIIKRVALALVIALTMIAVFGCDTTKTYNEYSYWRWEQMERDASYELGGRMYQ